MIELTPDELWSYANAVYCAKEKYPTLKQCARAFNCSVADIEQAIDDYQGERYLGLVVAIGIQGAGVAELARSEREVEAY